MENRSKSTFPFLGVIVSIAVCALLAIGVWLWWPISDKGPPEQVSTPLVLESNLGEALENAKPDSVESAVEVELGTPEPIDVKPSLPRLNESDESFKEKIRQQEGGVELLSLMIDSELIRKVVRATHSLSEGWVVKEYRPITSPKGPLLVTDTGSYDAENLRVYEIAFENYERYEKYISMLTQFSPESAAGVYRHFYPLFQQAYEELGLQVSSFHKVTLNALDEVLSSPIFPRDARLRQPSVMYIFADEKLESLSSLEKLKLRIGPENTVKLRSWSRSFKQEVEKLEL